MHIFNFSFPTITTKHSWLIHTLSFSLSIVYSLSLTSLSWANDSISNNTINSNSSKMVVSKHFDSKHFDTKERKVFDLTKVQADTLMDKDYLKYFGPYITNNLFSLTNQTIISPYTIGMMSTMDLRLVDIYTKYLNPQLNASVFIGNTANLSIYLPLISNNHIPVVDKQNFITDYYQAWNTYAPQANYALALVNTNSSVQDLTQKLNTTFLFITKEQKVLNTKLYTSNLTQNNLGELLLKPHSSIIAGVIDYNGVTNQSLLQIIITNNSNQNQAFVNTLNYYLRAIMETAQQDLKHPPLDHTFNKIILSQNKQLSLLEKVAQEQPASSELDISSPNTDVKIEGGTISAGNINITSGHNIIISNSNLTATNINASAGHQIDLQHNKIKADSVVISAPIIHTDQYSLFNLKPTVYDTKSFNSNYDLPRVAGINNYLVNLLNYQNRQFASKPIIPLAILAAISSHTNLATTLLIWQKDINKFEEYGRNFITQFPHNSYLYLNKFPFLANQYQYVQSYLPSSLGVIAN